MIDDLSRFIGTHVGSQSFGELIMLISVSRMTLINYVAPMAKASLAHSDCELPWRDT